MVIAADRILTCRGDPALDLRTSASTVEWLPHLPPITISTGSVKATAAAITPLIASAIVVRP